MTTFDRVKQLADNQKISIVELEEKLGFGRNSLYSWKTKTPNGDRLKKVADYFNVTTDYLLGRTDKPSIESAEPESDDLDVMLDRMMSFDGEPMDDHDREVIRAYLKGRFAKK